MGVEFAEGVVERCSHCGASMEVSPDAVVMVCGYCGWATLVGGGEASILALDGSDAHVLRSVAESFVRSKAGVDSRIREMSFLMVPFWVVELDASTRYNGYSVETRTRYSGTGKGARTQTYQVYKPVKGELRERVAVTVYARRFEAIFGLGQIKALITERYQGASELNPEKIRGWTAINSELGEIEAVEAAKTRVAEEHRKRVEAMTSKIFDCYTSAKPLSSRLILYPVVEVRYEKGGKSYRLCIDGYKAYPRVVMAELPLTAKTRIARALLTLAGIAGAILLALLLQPLVTAEGVPDELRLAAIVAPPLASIIVGGVGAYSATLVQRLMRVVGERDMKSLGEG